MVNESTAIVQKLWNYCTVLRDDGISYLDYIEQFLRMAHEQTEPPFDKPSSIPKELDWPSLANKDGDELEVHYRHILEDLAKEKGAMYPSRIAHNCHMCNFVALIDGLRECVTPPS